MPSVEELLNSDEQDEQIETYAEENKELVIDAETRVINIPENEVLFGVKGDKNIERKYFRCPKIVGDNVDLSKHLIYIAYVYTESNSGSIFPTVGIQPYHCDDVKAEGDDITFSWKLSENVFQSAGFIVFKMYAKEKEDSPYMVFNTAPAIGTVLYTIGDGVESIVSENPDIINQLLAKMESVQEIATPEAMQNYVNDYLTENPPSGMTEEQELQLQQKINKPVDEHGTTQNGTSGQILETNGDGTTRWTDKPEGIKEGSVNVSKLANDIISDKSINGFYIEKLLYDLTTIDGLIKGNFNNDVPVEDDLGEEYYTPYIKISEYESLTLSVEKSNPFVRFYNAEQNFLSSKYFKGIIKNYAPENAVYIVISANISGVFGDTFKLTYNGEYESKVLQLESKGTSEYTLTLSKMQTDEIGTTTDMIPVVKGESYDFDAPSNGYYEFYNASGIRIGNQTQTNKVTFTIPIDGEITHIKFGGFNSNKATLTGKFFLKKMTNPELKLVSDNFDSDMLVTLRQLLNIGAGTGGEFYNALDYGLSELSNDNTKVMQELIDLVNENGGGVIWIPIGTYKFDSFSSSYDMTSNITTLLEAKSHVSILGESLSGTVLKVTGSTPQGAGLFCQNSVHSGEILEGCTYQNFTVDMSEASLTTYTHRGKAFYYSGIKDCIFRDLRLISTPSTSLGIDMLDNVVMDSIYVYEGGRQWTDGGNGGAGIGIGTGKWENENYIIRNCVCDSCGHFGIFLEDQGIFSSAKDQNHPKGQIIANNVVRNGRHYAFGLRGGKNVIFTGNNAYENIGGMYLDYGAENVIITNNIFVDCTENGLLFGNEDNTVNGTPESIPCDTVFISGNLFKNNKVAIKELTVPTNMEKSNNMFIGNTSES